MLSILQCMDCGRQYRTDEVIYTCNTCGGLLDVQHDLDYVRRTVTTETLDRRRGTDEFPYLSGVWRYKELVYPGIAPEHIVSRPEGNTNLYHTPRLAQWAGVARLHLKHEGENPTGSFKDRGMTGGVSQAKVLGMDRVACASTGNTSASLAAYAAWGGLHGIVLLQNQQIAYGKLAQAIAYGSTCIRIAADFDRNLALVREISAALGIYVLNSVNPFRLEGQKTIMFEAMQQLRWQAPDWIVVPGGNLGNSSAFGKGLHELHQLGFIDRLPRIAVIQADGANPLYRAYQTGFSTFTPTHAETIATAIKIGNPVNYPKAVRALRWTDGVVEQVSDQEIMDAKALIDGQGIGCEPASGCTLAGIRKLVEQGVIKPSETVVGVLTGHILKDAEAAVAYHADQLDGIHAVCPNHVHDAEPTLDSLRTILEPQTQVPHA